MTSHNSGDSPSSDGTTYDARRRKILEDLSPFDFTTYEHFAMHDYHEIYDPLFTGILYQEWLQGRPWRLRCHNTPRSGKTTFAAAIANNIRSCAGHLAVPIFLDIPDVAGHHTLLDCPQDLHREALSRCLLRQIVQRKLLAKQESKFMQSVATGKIEAATLSLTSAEELIALETTDAVGVFVIFDGSPDDDVLTQLHDYLNTITSVRFSALSIEHSARFTTVDQDDCDHCDRGATDVYWSCRECPEPALEGPWAYFCKDCYSNGGKCEVDDNHTLAEPYLHRTASLGQDDDALKDYIVKKLEEEVELQTPLGISLRKSVEGVAARIFANSQNKLAIARLNVQHLIEHQSLTDVVGTFARLPHFINEYYDGFMQSIVDGPDRTVALATLAIISQSDAESRSLTCGELNGVLNWYNGTASTMTNDNIAILTHELLTASTPNGTIAPSHTDVSTYLAEECDHWYNDVKPDMATLCTSRIDSFLQNNSDDKTPRDVLARFLEDPFLIYSWECWGHHCFEHSTKDVQEAALRLLNTIDSLPVMLRRATYLMRISAAQDDEQRMLDRPYGTALNFCAHFGLVALARQYIELSCSVRPVCDVVNSIDVLTGATALMVAVQHDQLEFVRYLLEAEADHNIRDFSNHSALSRAIERTSAWQDDGHDTASAHGILSLLLEELETSAVNIRVVDNQTLLMLAIQHKQNDAVCRLLQHTNLDLDVVDARGRNLIHVAADSDNIDVLYTIAKTHDSALRRTVNRLDASGRSPLVALLQRLTNAVPDLDEPASGNDEMIDLASDMASTKIVETAKAALDLMNTIEADFKAQDDYGRTILHHAVIERAQGQTVEALIDLGAHIDKPDHAGRTALHIASAMDNEDAVQALLRRGSDQALRDACGLTALEIAQRRQSIAAIECLRSVSSRKQEDLSSEQLAVCTSPLSEELCISSDIQHTEQAWPDPFGQTALHWAVRDVDDESIGLLLQDQHIDPNAKDASGTTAMQMAINCLLEGLNSDEYLRLVEELFLQSDRVDVNVTNNAGLTILEQAMDGIDSPEALELALLLIALPARRPLSKYQAQNLYEKAVQKRDGRVELLHKLVDAGAHPLQSPLPFCEAVDGEDDDKDCAERAHRLGEEAVLRLTWTDPSL